MAQINITNLTFAYEGSFDNIFENVCNFVAMKQTNVKSKELQNEKIYVCSSAPAWFEHDKHLVRQFY